MWKIIPSQSRASSLDHGVCCDIGLPKRRAKTYQPSREGSSAEIAAKQGAKDNCGDKGEQQATKESSTTTDLSRIIFLHADDTAVDIGPGSHKPKSEFWLAA